MIKATYAQMFNQDSVSAINNLKAMKNISRDAKMKIARAIKYVRDEQSLVDDEIKSITEKYTDLSWKFLIDMARENDPGNPAAADKIGRPPCPLQPVEAEYKAEIAELNVIEAELEIDKLPLSLFKESNELSAGDYVALDWLLEDDSDAPKAAIEGGLTRQARRRQEKIMRIETRNAARKAALKGNKDERLQQNDAADQGKPLGGSA